MRISRLFLPLALEDGKLLKVEGEPCHYIRNVLRLRKGWQLTVFDGQGTECPATVDGFERDVTFLRLGTATRIDRESPLRTHLAIGISRGERMDFAVQKAVELGVHRITPLITEHCVVRMDEEKRHSRRQHWQRVVHNACEQSGRNEVPKVEVPLPLNEWMIHHKPAGLTLFLDPYASQGLTDLSPPSGPLTLLSGPEGGFSDQERELSKSSGCIGLKLGPRILRTETAALAALSAIQALWGDLG